MSQNRSSSALVFGVALAAALLASLTFGAGSAVADPNRVDLCHIPPGNPANYHNITVNASAVPAHFAHGDLEGTCGANCATLCDDSNPCTIDCYPEAGGTCLNPGPPVECNDDVVCTVDGCDPHPTLGGCFSDPSDSVCGDGFVCDPVDGCLATAECPCYTLEDVAIIFSGVESSTDRFSGIVTGFFVDYLLFGFVAVGVFSLDGVALSERCLPANVVVNPAEFAQCQAILDAYTELHPEIPICEISDAAPEGACP